MTKRERRIEQLYILFVFTILFTWSILIPIGSGPDEKMKYDICNYLASQNRLPHGGDPVIRNGIWGISYAFMPILSYCFSALFMKCIGMFTTNAIVIFIAARFISVLCGTGMAVMVIKIGHELFAKKTWRWCFIVSVTMLPQVVYLGCYLNTDSLALFSISVIIYAWIRGIKSRWNWKSVLILGVGIGICALSYYNAYGYLLTSVILYIVSWFVREERKVNWKDFWKKGIIIAVVAIVIAGWWFVRNAVIYDGDFLGMQAESEYAEEYAMDGMKPSQLANSNNLGESLSEMLIGRKWIKTTLMSFSGILGTFEVIALNRIYWLYIFTIAFALIMCLLRYGSSSFRKSRVKDKKRILLEVTFLINMMIPIMLSLYYSYYSDFQPQGRYIMPMLIPLMYFVTTGGCTFVDFITTQGMMKNVKMKEMICSIVYHVILFCGMMGPIVCLILLKKNLY